MQKEFEKQVKEKMEELDFVPSSPVWTKIEAQIRQEKDRRRMLIWLPLLTLLVGGSIAWYVISANGKSQVSHQPVIEQNSPKGYAPGQSSTSQEIATENQSTTHSTGINKGTTSNSAVQKNSPTTVTPLKEPAAREETIAGKKEKGIQEYQEPALDIVTVKPVKNKAISHNNTETPGNRNYIQAKKQTTLPGEQVNEPVPALHTNPVLEKIKLNIIDSEARKKEFVLTLPGEHSIRASQPANETVAASKTFGRSKWKFGFELSGGISGAGEGLNIYGGRPELLSDAANNAPPPPSYLQNRSLEPSPIENGISFGAGLLVQKQLNDRFDITTGLRYQYLSTRRMVGIKVNSFASGNISSGGYTTAQYHDYRNRFHFISLPLSLNYRPFRKFPLQVLGGVSFQHLLATNALHFNQSTRVYQKDETQFRKNQVFAEGGLSYSFPVKKLSVSVGPQVQYSLVSMGEAYKGQHLFTAGFRTKIIVNR